MSTSSRFFSASLVLLLIFPLLAHSVTGLDPLFHFCSSSGNFTSNSYYQTNLNKLLASLRFKSPRTGFGLDSVGQSPDQANGLALCRGDVTATDCKTCVVEASREIRKRCPYNKGAVVWYDNCLLKYSDVEFFGEIDDRNKFYMWNLRNVSNPSLFNQKVKELLSRLSEEAYLAPKLYASGEMEIGGGESRKLYGLVQCTRDLSRVDCKKCLDGSISELPSCCDGKEGGRVVGGSCNVRYEIYSFVN